jgi:hypothetical protein
MHPAAALRWPDNKPSNAQYRKRCEQKHSAHSFFGTLNFKTNMYDPNPKSLGMDKRIGLFPRVASPCQALAYCALALYGTGKQIAING